MSRSFLLSSSSFWSSRSARFSIRRSWSRTSLRALFNLAIELVPPFQEFFLGLKLRLHADRLGLAVGVGKNLVGEPPSRLGAEPSRDIQAGKPPSMPTISPISPPIIGPSTSPPGLSSSGLRHSWTGAGESLSDTQRHPEGQAGVVRPVEQKRKPEGLPHIGPIAAAGARGHGHQFNNSHDQPRRVRNPQDGTAARSDSPRLGDLSDRRWRAGHHAGIVHATGGVED